MLRIIILFVALGAGGLCAWLLLAANPAPQAVAAAAPQDTMQVLVASADLAQGQVVGETDLRWQSWPKDAMSTAFISHTKKPDAMAVLAGTMVRSRIVAGEPIQEEKLARTSAGMLASMLPAGKRAVAIRVSAESAAGGFILPNDRVDVLHTLTRQGHDGMAHSLSKTILTNIRVLAVDQRAEDVKDPVFVGKTATLELDADQAEILAAGQATGTLSLALRSFADVNAVPVARVAKDTSIRIFHGERSETVRFQ